MRRDRGHRSGSDGGDARPDGGRPVCDEHGRSNRMSVDLRGLLGAPPTGERQRGIAALCTAHPTVIEIALAHGAAARAPVLIEATCNQVNQDGGYTGMRPADFRRLVEDAAARTG